MTLGAIIEGIRALDPRFTEEAVPDRVLGMRLSARQRSLAQQATQRRRDLLAQVMTIGFDLSAANDPGTVGAGTSGGLPGTTDGASAALAEGTVGHLIGFDFAHATEAVAEFAVTSATTSTLTKAAAGWTVNAYANKIVDVVAGPGAGSDAARYILSNTATVLTITGTWKATPTTATVVRIIDAPTYLDDQTAVATALPGLTQTTGYLVRLDAAGTPYLDLTTPIVSHVEAGIPLPDHVQMLGGTVFLTGANVLAAVSDAPTIASHLQATLTITDYASRFRADFPAAYVLGQSLFLLGSTSAWAGVDSIAVRYVPIPPLLGTTATPLSEYFLLPDTAYDALIAAGASDAAARLQAMGIELDLSYWEAQRQEAASLWLTGLTTSQNQITRTTRRNR